MKQSMIYAVAAIATLLASCSMNDKTGPYYTRDTAFGVITKFGYGGNFSILNDYGDIFEVVRYDTPGYSVSVGERVLFDYCVLDVNDDAGNKKIRLYGFNSLLVKPVELLSQSEGKNFGADPIRCSASFGGEYINLNYEYPCGGDADHVLSLVVDDTAESDYVELYLHHNANGETLSSTDNKVYGVASFRIVQLIAQGANNMTIRLHWRWYNGDGQVVERSDTGVFTPFSRINEEFGR